MISVQYFCFVSYALTRLLCLYIMHIRLQTHQPPDLIRVPVVAGFLLSCLVIRLLGIWLLGHLFFGRCDLICQAGIRLPRLIVSLAWCLRLRLHLRLPSVGIVLLRGGVSFFILPG